MISENKFVYALWLADSADVGVEFSKEEAQELARMIDGYLARIAELEAMANCANHTQTDTVVYGKGSDE